MPRWLSKLEYKFRGWGIDNLMIYITGTMLAVYLAENLMRTPISQYLTLDRASILQGQVWRLITFVFVPPQNSMILWVALWLYLYYFIGSSLENTWGKTKFTMFYLFGVIGAIIGAMISGEGHNMYLNLSMFLAFAALAPDMQLMLFLLIPVKIKYLAYLNIAMLAFSFIFSDWPTRAAIFFSFANLILFFSDDFLDKWRNWKRYGKQRRNFRKSMKNQRDMYGN